MKRTVPMGMTDQWGRPPPSCQACRQKKRRCDRARPCSNCTQRNIPCEYDGKSQFGSPPTHASNSLYHGNADQTLATPQSPPGGPKISRLKRLEQAVFTDPSKGTPQSEVDAEPPLALRFTRFNAHSQFSAHERARNGLSLATHLPPISEARALLSHFVGRMQPTIGVLHIPSTRNLLEQTYLNVLDDTAPDPTTLLLLFSIFAGSALVFSPQLLQQLAATPDQADAAFKSYMQISQSVMEDSQQVPPSTTALAAMTILTHLVSNENGCPVEAHLIRMRCYWMARSMQIHCLDAPQNRKRRQLEGCNMIEAEVQRRIWWNMVATDWLSAFAGGNQEGTYVFQPKHMCVDLPSNVDDEYITSEGISNVQPLSEPTSMTGFIYRVKFAEICREVADAMPPVLAEVQEPDYSVILALDARFRSCLDELPVFYKLDPESIKQTEGLCAERHYITWQRTTSHLSFHTRLCRLHRPYHIPGIADPKYAYSREVCVRSAQAVLDLRRSMDISPSQVGLRPSRFWIVVHHVFIAALTLATDVSFNPHAPDAEARKVKVLAAYQTLERSMEESCSFKELIQKNLRLITSTLETRPPAVPTPTGSSSAATNISSHSNIYENTSGGLPADSIVTGAGGNDPSQEPGPWDPNWDQLWSEFLAVAPELDLSQWDVLFDGANTMPP
ncbi:Zn(II)2Cys6 transcription factor [Aspergillus lucknowensis]|uniref:Zn(2)-C6 fungal-type domain-containing protein n=1 Tax=Aspergillus lucknowensis TaxID=176173 RepID=A0ABR4LD16_9EURO